MRFAPFALVFLLTADAAGGEVVAVSGSHPAW
jgi:hypothetical protein